MSVLVAAVGAGCRQRQLSALAAGGRVEIEHRDGADLDAAACLESRGSLASATAGSRSSALTKVQPPGLVSAPQLPGFADPKTGLPRSERLSPMLSNQAAQAAMVSGPPGTYPAGIR